MDPITGIGLTASVIQLVQFSLDVVAKCRDIYQHGSPAEYIATNDTTEQLVSITGALQKSLKASATSGITFSKDEKDLYELSRKCEDCAENLLNELRKLKADPKASPFQVVRKVALSIRKKDKIDKIKEQLESYRSILQTSLLHRLSIRFDAQNLQHNESFQSLDLQLQHTVTCLAASRTSLEDLIVHESEQTRQYINTEVARLDQRRIDKSIYDETIHVLLYPDIFLREEQPQLTAFEDSYDFIFNEPNDHQKSWSSFVNWLRSGHELYWINGKAGSGKSTIMNYIRRDDRRQSLLKKWHPTRQLLTPSFFFWVAGSPLQKSVIGLLRSLIYQILIDCPDLLTYCKVRNPHEVTEERLSSTLLSMLLQNEVPLAVCMFIDGLDEFEGPSDSIIKLVKQLSNSPFVKICVSSRPLNAFNKAFECSSGLKLQDLTHDSIRIYAEAQLNERLLVKIPSKNDWYEANELIYDIINRADGVFLWAVMVVREVREGLEEEASIKELKMMVAMLPSELEDLFASMLHRIKPAYCRDAARFLQITLLSSESLDLCGFHLSHQQEVVEDAPYEYEKIPLQDLVTGCNSTSTRLLTHTAGLLELVSKRNRGKLPFSENSEQSLLYSKKVCFIHRTARDFLLAKNEARFFIRRRGSPEKVIHLSLAWGLLSRIAQQPPINILKGHSWPNPVCLVFQKVLTHVSIVETITGQAQTMFMNSLDYESLSRDYSSNRPNSYLFHVHPWMVGYAADGIDLAGMAASTGMTRYVCSKLNLNVTTNEIGFISNVSYPRSSQASEVLLSWLETHDSNGKRHLDTSVHLRVCHISRKLHLQDYRREIIAYLKLPSNYGCEKSKIVETYLLLCCTGGQIASSNLELMRILLRAGANTMASFKMSGHGFLSSSIIEPAWQKWIWELLKMRRHYMAIHGKSGSMALPEGFTIDEIAYTTHAMRNCGADINLMLPPANSAWYRCFLRRRDLEHESLDFLVSASAGFVLQECFGQIPEFQTLYKDMDSSTARKLKSIFPNPGTNDHYGELFLDSSSPDLWPLVEKWEKSGRRVDLDALQLEMRALFEQNRPPVS